MTAMGLCLGGGAKEVRSYEGEEKTDGGKPHPYESKGIQVEACATHKSDGDRKRKTRRVAPTDGVNPAPTKAKAYRLKKLCENGKLPLQRLKQESLTSVGVKPVPRKMRAAFRPTQSGVEPPHSKNSLR